MESFARVLGIPFHSRTSQRPQPKLFGENGFGTTRIGAGIEACLNKACQLPRPDGSGKSRSLSSKEFAHIQSFLEILDTQAGRVHPYVWSLRPRIYTLLRAIGALVYMDEFTRNDIYDISIPFDFQTLPDFLSDAAVREQFLACQVSVLTDARHLENSSEEHIYFNGSAEEHIIPHRGLGHGGFGWVDVVISRLSAKAYARKRVARGRDSEDNRRVQQYIVDEIRLMKSLQHPHLTKIIQSYSDYKYIGFLMEPIADCNLRAFLAKTPFPDSERTTLRQFYGCLAGGVEYLHRKKIRHRDLKLENVLVKNSSVYIADFGTAMGWTSSNRGTTQSRGVPVTEHYMSPEVDSRQSRNNASDMWSLGIVFLEILTVLKGHTISKWREHLGKRADRLKIEPWPCRNLSAVHEWMAILTSTQRHTCTDDESQVWRDNEPLVWIKSLLEPNPVPRLTSKALTTSIADSMYSRSFACPDCTEEFMDPRYRYNDDQDLSGDTRNMIDSEVTALFGVVTEPLEQMDDRKSEFITKWLGQTREDRPASDHAEPMTFSMPGAFTSWLDGEANRPEATPSQGLYESPMKVDPVPISNRSPLSSPKEILHEGGFFVDLDEDSSEADSKAEDQMITSDLFPIVQDSSSDGSDEPQTAQNAFLDQILEEVEEPSLSHSAQHEGLSNHPLSTAESSEEPVVRFGENKNIRYQYVEEDTSTQTVDLSHAGRALSETGHVLQLNPWLGPHQDGTHETDEIQQHASTHTIDPGLEMVDSTVDKALINQFIPERPLRSASFSLLSRMSPLKQRPRQNQPILLPRYNENPASSFAQPLHPREGQSSVQAAGATNMPGDKRGHSSNEDSQSMFALKPLAVEAGSKLVPKKLSTANVQRLNRDREPASRSERRSFADDHFTPAEFIEAAWLAAEAADSLATSVLSDTSARRLRGIKLIWDDKAYHYLEHYTRLGKVAAVRHLLDQGCNSGTVLKPRPMPLLNAIKGRSANHNKCARALIKAGTNVNAKHLGKTPIHGVIEMSYFKGYQKLLAMLLAAGAAMNAPDETGEYPLTKVFKGSTSDIPLEDYQKESLALIFHPKVVSEVDPNVRQPLTLDTPLHQAVRRRTAQAVALLIHKGAQVNAMNASGATPLLLAANQWRGKLSDQQERTLHYLLDADGIDTDVKGGTLGRTALHYAAAAGCAVALDMLIERGSTTTTVDKQGQDALTILQKEWGGDNKPNDYQVMYDMLTG